MPKTIILENVLHTNWKVDLNAENVVVPFQIVDGNGEVWYSGTAIFWKEMPLIFDNDGNPLEPPKEWFQIPSEHLTKLVSLNTDIHSALLNRFVS